jgi:hypothetical protein
MMKGIRNDQAYEETAQSLLQDDKRATNTTSMTSDTANPFSGRGMVEGERKTGKHRMAAMFLSSGFRIQSTQCDEMNKPKTKCGRAT